MKGGRDPRLRPRRAWLGQDAVGRSLILQVGNVLGVINAKQACQLHIDRERQYESDAQHDRRDSEPLSKRA